MAGRSATGSRCAPEALYFLTLSDDHKAVSRPLDRLHGKVDALVGDKCADDQEEPVIAGAERKPPGFHRGVNHVRGAMIRLLYPASDILGISDKVVGEGGCAQIPSLQGAPEHVHRPARRQPGPTGDADYSDGGIAELS